MHREGLSISPPGRLSARIPGRPARAPWPGPPAPGPTHGHRPGRRPPAGAPQAAHRGHGCAVANRYGAGNMQTGRACPPLVCARSRAAMPLRGVAPAPARCGPHCSAGPAGQWWVARRLPGRQGFPAAPVRRQGGAALTPGPGSPAIVAVGSAPGPGPVTGPGPARGLMQPGPFGPWLHDLQRRPGHPPALRARGMQLPIGAAYESADYAKKSRSTRLFLLVYNLIRQQFCLQ